MQYSDKLDSTECCCSDWVLKDFALVSVDSLYWPLSVVVKVRRWLNSCLLVIHKKQNIIFPLSCPVLKVGCLLFLMLPSVNLQNVLAVWSVIRWMPYSSRYTWMVSLLHFIFEGKSCNTYFLGYHQLLKWSPRTRSFPWIHELHHSECPGRISVWRGSLRGEGLGFPLSLKGVHNSGRVTEHGSQWSALSRQCQWFGGYGQHLLEWRHTVGVWGTCAYSPLSMPLSPAWYQTLYSKSDFLNSIQQIPASIWKMAL